MLALLVPMLVNAFMYFRQIPVQLQLECLAGVVLVVAMAVRLTWARPILLGGIGFWAFSAALSLAAFPGLSPMWLLVHGGLVAFLAPWRRGEITGAGASLALSVWAFAATTCALSFAISTPNGWQVMAPGAELACGAALVATCGGIVRARWAALASLLAAVGLVLAFAQLSAPLTMRMSAMRPELFRIGILALVGSGAVAAALAAIVSWKTARSTLGTLRAIAS